MSEDYLMIEFEDADIKTITYKIESMYDMQNAVDFCSKLENKFSIKFLSSEEFTNLQKNEDEKVCDS